VCHTKLLKKDLRELFGSYGDIARVDILYDRETQRSRGVAFIRFTTEEAQNKVAEELPETEHLGRTIFVQKARERGAPDPRQSGENRGQRGGEQRGGEQRGFEQRGGEQRGEPRRRERDPKSKSVFVGNLGSSTEEDLKSFFESCGEIARVKIVSYQGQSKGFGFVEFENSESVENAIQKSGESIGDRSIKVDYATESKPPGDREGRGGNEGFRGDRGGDRGGDRFDRGDRGDRDGSRGGRGGRRDGNEDF